MVSYYKKGKTGIIEFNDLDSKVNLLSNRNLDILKHIIDGILEGHTHIDALFFISKKKGIFVAGADIKELAKISTPEEAIEFCKKGQDLFSKIESLNVPTFAILNGACIGGGLELALSCNCIMATGNKKVKFALPEVKLGISLGFGGSRRLAERIGERNAQLLIDTGNFINVKEAKCLNLVDKIVSERERFMYQKLKKFSKKDCRPGSQGTEKKHELERLEREVLTKKIFQPLAKNALSSYLLVSKYRDYPETEEKIGKISSIKRVMVIGAGTMGRDITYLLSTEANLQVNINDINRRTLRKARSHIKYIYKDAVEREIFSKDEANSRFKNISFGKKDLNNPDIVIESIIEDHSAKKNLFSKIEGGLSKDTIIVTNTSCLSIEELSKSLRRSDRFLGVHFFNPAYKMKLVEVIPTNSTSKEVLDKVVLFLKKIGKIPIVVKDSPGFLVNRMLLPYLNEAIFMLEEGFRPDDIEATILEFGMPVGPIELSKEIGLDVLYKASKALEDKFEERIKVPRMLEVGANKILKLQRKKYPHNRLIPSKNSEDIVERLLSPMRREAGLCLKEGIVGNQEVIDIALLL